MFLTITQPHKIIQESIQHQLPHLNIRRYVNSQPCHHCVVVGKTNTTIIASIPTSITPPDPLLVKVEGFLITS